MENEFKLFKIPPVWRKYIWVGLVGFLIYLLKRSEQVNNELQQKWEDCVRGRLGDKDAIKKADSIQMQKLMDRAFESADRRIIQPRIDSIKNSNL